MLGCGNVPELENKTNSHGSLAPCAATSSKIKAETETSEDRLT